MAHHSLHMMNPTLWCLAGIAICLLELERLKKVDERSDIEEHIDIERHFKVEERARRHLRVLRRKAKRAKRIDNPEPQRGEST